MARSVKDPETECLAKALADRTGETITLATRRALEDRLRRLGSQAEKEMLVGAGGKPRRWAALPFWTIVRQKEILGYNEHGRLN